MENITQYFLDLPKPTGDVLEAINVFGQVAAGPCRETLTGPFELCTITWCEFTKGLPSSVSASYSTYLSAVTSFRKAKGATMSILATSCPILWGYPDAAQHEWIKIAWSHADCYTKAHLQTSNAGAITGSSAPYKTRTDSMTTTSATFFIM
ncbi:hypothetical protein CONLIGDRAFT_680997 [Coniochaeta ligniaria NRRL 30616]|uniref:DUF7735 domain-containing protein n=1 Tax=Coniochaeta ligniaria NRRL 30616 TaxID=1408157 RepID=A0A1J7JR28_9PEZI|nr:hypothetical protein CONLIGDRAFT_680997 [Coniochaeta ligniaria NRRL 30616]